MPFKRPVSVLVLFMIVGGLLGGILGEVLQAITPEGFLREFFLQSLLIGVNSPFILDLHLVKLIFGFTLRLTLLSLVGILVGIYLYLQT